MTKSTTRASTGLSRPCSGRSLLHTFSPFGADWAKARSPKRSDGSLCGPTGKGTGLAAQPEAGATWPQAALTGPPTAALTAYLGVYLPWGGEGGDQNDAPPAAHGSRAAAGGEDGAYLCGSLEGGGELNNCPARSQVEAASAEARARGVPPPLFLQPQRGERASIGTGRAA